MLKKLSKSTNFILLGIVVGLFVGVSIRQVLGQATDGTVRADSLTVNTGGASDSIGLTVAHGNLLVSDGNLDVRTGNISANGNGKEIGLAVWSGNALVLDGKIGVGVRYPQEKLDVQGNIRSVGYIKAGSLCLGSTCIDEAQLKAMMSGGTVPGGTVTPGTMTGTGTTSDPYKCPFTYTVVGGGAPGNSCVNRSDVKDTCCKSGSMTSCVPISGGVSIVGSGCNYIDPSSLPEKHLGEPVDQGLAWFATYPTSGGNPTSPRPVGSFCQYGTDDHVYEKAPYTDKDDNVVSGAKVYAGTDCLDKTGVTGWCYRAHKWVQPCID